MDSKAEQLPVNTNIDKLPSLPHVLLQLLEICHNESFSYSEVAAILKQDPALYMRIFSVCHRNQCSADNNNTAEQKLQKLGINIIKSIAVTAAVQQFFSRTNHARTHFIKQNLKHAVYCATVAESLAHLCHYANTNEAYTAGLLHDIGQLALEVKYTDKYVALLKKQNGTQHLYELEQSTFNTNHQTVGADLLSHHGISTFVCDAVRYHHEAPQHILDAHPLVKIIYLANQLSSNHFSPDNDDLFETAELLLGLNKALIIEVLTKATAHVTDYAKNFGLQLASDATNDSTSKQIIASDELKQVQLAEQIRNIALLDGIHQHLSRTDGQSALLDAIAQHSSILFGVNQSILFLYNATTDCLHALASSNQPTQLSDINVSLQAGRSLIADALLNQSATHTFSEETDKKNLTVIDRQLIGMGKHQGFICLPMMMNRAAVGALVFAVDKPQYQSLWKQKSLLMRFVNEIAHTISANQNQHIDSTDISQLTQLQSRIREVIHEVRNPLSIMNNYLGILSYKLEDDKPAQEDIETVRAEIDRVGTIINRLSKDNTRTGETVSVDINAVIADLTHIFQTSLFATNNIQITLDLDAQINVLQSNANALKQIYTNLIKNAVEALPTNGQIIVYTQDHVNVDGKEHIEISVADNGPGITKAILPKLFSPIETTKGGDHAGLGLTIVKNLVSELHGSIRCRSNEKGTSFYLLLPKNKG